MTRTDGRTLFVTGAGLLGALLVDHVMAPPGDPFFSAGNTPLWWAVALRGGVPVALALAGAWGWASRPKGPT